MNPATLSALAALAGSAIGALASFATTWLTQHHQDHTQRKNQEASRRERLFGEFIDEASRTYADGMMQERLGDPSKLVPIYATINKLRLFAQPATIGAAEAVLDGIVETYAAAPAALKPHSSSEAARDILQPFAEACRAELSDLR